MINFHDSISLVCTNEQCLPVRKNALKTRKSHSSSFWQLEGLQSSSRLFFSHLKQTLTSFYSTWRTEAVGPLMVEIGACRKALVKHSSWLSEFVAWNLVLLWATYQSLFVFPGLCYCSFALSNFYSLCDCEFVCFFSFEMGRKASNADANSLQFCYWLTKSATGERLCIWICLSTSTCMRAIGRARASATRASSCSLLCTRQNPPQSSIGSESSSAVSRSDKDELCLL